MGRPPDRAVFADIRSALEEALGSGVKPLESGASDGWNGRLLLAGDGLRLAVRWKPVGDAANVGAATRDLKTAQGPRQRGRGAPVIPLLAVPYMGATGRRLCAESGLSWVDLSGNAQIDAPGRTIRILGHSNKFASRGRPADVFAPRSSRIIRALLMEPERAFTQRELVAVTGVDKGRVSRVVRRLEAMGLVMRENTRSLRLASSSLALDAWWEAYDFEKNDVIRGHVAVRDPAELVQRIQTSTALDRRWALTGLAGAWALTRFAMFRLVSVLVPQLPAEGELESLGFRGDARGANLWVIRPADEGAFAGAAEVEGVPCAHPVQVYLDLKAHPERSQEAALEVRRRYLEGPNG
jgi:hypothetical protein